MSDDRKKIRSKLIFQRFFLPAARLLLSLLARIKISGTEHIIRSSRVHLIISNHKSSFDPLLLCTAIPSNSGVLPLNIIAKDQLFTNFLGRFFFTAMGAFPAFKGQGMEKSLSIPRRLLNKGETVVFFPEGKRIRQDEIGEGKIGAALLLCDFPDTEIIPIVIKNSHAISRSIFSFSRPLVEVVVGKPFLIGDKTAHLEPTAVLGILMDELRNLYGAPQAGKL